MRKPYPTRVLFLDFDGVLHPPKAIAGAKPSLTPAQIRAGWPQTLQHLPLLAQLLQAHPDVRVVVSSSWRLFLSQVELGELLSPIAPWYAGALHPRMTQRDTAITQWLSEHAVADYVVLDDVTRFFSGYPQPVAAVDRMQCSFGYCRYPSTAKVTSLAQRSELGMKVNT